MPGYGVLAAAEGTGLLSWREVQPRKVRNLRRDPRCVATTDDALDPVVVEGIAEVVTDESLVRGFLDLLNAKYDVDYPLGFLDPAVNATLCLSPHTAFGLLQADFCGSPTRWTFAREPRRESPSP